MKWPMIGAFALVAMGTAACKPAPTAADASAAAAVDQSAPAAVLDKEGRAGRFVGVGIYSAGSAWSRMAGADDPKAPPTRSKVADDQAIIVVQDTKTGELRACGDMTGYCISMNPWNKALTLAQIAPIKLNPPPTATPDPPVVTPVHRHHRKPPALAPTAPPVPQTPAETPAKS